MPLNPLTRLPRRGRSVLLGSVAALVALAGPLALSAAETTASGATSVPAPTVPTGLPSGIEDLASYVPANSCDPHAKPGTTALGDLLVKTYGSFYGIDRTCGVDPLPTSEHYDGRAVDYFQSVRVPAQKAKIQAFISWLFAKDAQGHTYANARRLGVMYLIWNNKIWGSYRSSEGWRPYSSCATHPTQSYDTTCHRDHIHISLSWAGAMKRTSFWTRKVAATDYGPCREAGLNWAAPYVSARTTPCPSYPHVSAPSGASSLLKTLTTYSGMRLQRGDSGPVVKAVQQAVGATADGSFGPLTQAAVISWQKAHAVPATGVVDSATWRALLSAGMPKAPVPTSRVSHPELTRYKHQTLHVGSHGAAVAAVQRRLHMNPHRGNYGAKTKARVQRFQRNHHVRATGTVDSPTWKALGA